MKALLLAASIVTVGYVQEATAQPGWPAITRQAKPWTRWWWLGSQVNKKDLTTVMQQYQVAGLGGLEITPIYGVQGETDQYIPFLSPKWMDVFAHTLKEGKRLNLGIDLANATGWPFGGPWIGDEDACKYMTSKVYQLSGGGTLNEKIEFIQEPLVRTSNNKALKIEEVRYPVSANPDLQAMSLDQVRFSRTLPLQTLMAYPESGAAVDLTSKVDAGGTLNWTAPAGKWTLYAIFMGWHGKQVERAAPGGEGNVIDHFSATALQHYLQPFDKAFRGMDLSGLRGFFNDSYEVDDARGQSNYTPDLFKEFKIRRGYDLRTQLPALLRQDVADKNSRVLCDYRMTIDELILEQFTGEWHKWAGAKGKIVRNQSHGSPANTLDLYGVVDIPETEGNEILRIKFAPSAAHVTGKQLASSESATWLNEHFVSTLSDVKKALDIYFLGGVNHIFYHGTVYSPPTEPWPGRLFYAAVHFTQANPFWNNFPALNQYVARTQSFLQQGKPDNDVLLFFPMMDKYSLPERDMLQHFDGMRPEFTGTAFESAAQNMQDHGYAFDYISDRQLLQVKPAGKKLLTGGNNYQAVLVPDAKFMLLSTLQKLTSLAKNGATILFYKNLPADVPGFGKLEEHRQAFREIISQLQFTDAPDVKVAKLGLGRFVVSSKLDALFQLAAIRKEPVAELGLQFNRRKLANGATLYFLANRSNKKQEGWFTLSPKMKGAMIYNMLNGKSGAAKLQAKAGETGGTEVWLNLQPDESCILQTSATSIPGKVYAAVTTAKDPVEIRGDWTLRFDEGGPSLPPTQKLQALKPWTEFEDNGYQYFSGTATYSIHFAKPAASARSYMIDLGKVFESAEVWINGKKLATLIGPDFSFDINSKDLLTNNFLEIKVSNSMANRIIDLDKRGVKWKKFNNTNFPARMGTNRGPDGLFDASKWVPRVSGLQGPVTIGAIE